MNGVLFDILGVLAVAALTFGTAVFVAAEFSLTTLERSTVENHLRQVGDARAKRVHQAVQTLSFQLSGAQVGITITTLTMGFIAEPIIAGWFTPLLSALSVPPAAAAAVGAPRGRRGGRGDRGAAAGEPGLDAVRRAGAAVPRDLPAAADRPRGGRHADPVFLVAALVHQPAERVGQLPGPPPRRGACRRAGL